MSNELDTQELQYSIDLSSSSENEINNEFSNLSGSDLNSGHSSSDESFPDITKLKPYDHEPVCPPRMYDLKDTDGDDSESEETSRIGNTDWCLCGNCKEMETYSESLCCLDTNGVPEELFEGIFEQNIIVIYYNKIKNIN